MVRAVVFAIGCCVVVPCAAARAQEQKPPGGDVQKAQALVNEALKKLKGSGARVTPIADETLRRSFPEFQFFAVLFPQYPVGREPPEPLKVANVFYVKNAEVKFLSDFKALESFFKSQFGTVKSTADAQRAATAWLRLSQELHQDGFFQFELSKEFSGKATAKGGPSEITGKAVVVPKGGNKGEIVATLQFDPAGNVTRVSETAKLIAGIRPICQASRLLDPDPLVRRIAERDLLLMGSAAQAYLEEQRALAGPELHAAITRVLERIRAQSR